MLVYFEYKLIQRNKILPYLTFLFRSQYLIITATEKIYAVFSPPPRNNWNSVINKKTEMSLFDISVNLN
jgi:hypothetical protein